MQLFSPAGMKLRKRGPLSIRSSKNGFRRRIRLHYLSIQPGRGGQRKPTNSWPATGELGGDYESYDPYDLYDLYDLCPQPLKPIPLVHRSKLAQSIAS